MWFLTSESDIKRDQKFKVKFTTLRSPYAETINGNRKWIISYQRAEGI